MCGLDSNLNRCHVAPRKSRTRNNNNKASHPKVTYYAKVTYYKCGVYGHIQQTCKVTPNEVQNYHMGKS